MSKKNRFYLECPYQEKNKCKSLGAYWDAKARRWYVPEGVDRETFKEWFPKEVSSEKKI